MPEVKDAPKKKKLQVLTPEFRSAFPAVFKPRAAVEGQELKYSIVMLFPKTTNIDVLKTAVLEAIQGKWGTDKTQWPKNLQLPFGDGDEKGYEGYAGHTSVKADNKERPGVVDRDKQAIIAPDEFYGGCYARATVRPFAYDVAGHKGVKFFLVNIQKIRDGEAFSGRTTPDADFDAIPMPTDVGGGKTDPLAGIGA